MPDDAYASNPAQVRIGVSRFLAREWGSLLFALGFFALIFGPLGYFVWKWLWLGLLLFPLAVLFLYYANSRLMKLGNVCAAKVVSLDPDRVAVFTDMSHRDDAAWPAVVIKDVSLSGISGGPAKVGERMPVAAFYEGETEQHWENLSVIEPIRGGTGNPAEIA